MTAHKFASPPAEEGASPAAPWSPTWWAASPPSLRRPSRLSPSLARLSQQHGIHHGLHLRGGPDVAWERLQGSARGRRGTDAEARGAADEAGRRRRAAGCRGVESRAVLAQDQTRAWPPKRADPLGTSLVRAVLRSPGGGDAEEGHRASSLPTVRATPVAGWSVRRSWVAQIEHPG